jgi:catechol-2,3-dioxygenase
LLLSEEKNENKMITNFTLVLMTKNLLQQTSFYKDILNLELIFSKKNMIGLGMNKRLFIVLQEEQSENSHHLSENKGHIIISFQCDGDIKTYKERIKEHGFKIRNTLHIIEQNIHYLFAEDYDGNEICLDFSDYLIE